MKIIAARLKSQNDSSVGEFIYNNALAIRNRIQENQNVWNMFHFIIEDGGVKRVREFGQENINEELVGQKIEIMNSGYFAQFNEDGTINIIRNVKEALLQKHSLDQFKMVRRLSKGIDIGDRVSDMNDQGANLHYMHNAIDNGIETYQDFEKHNKKFVPSWNLKHLLDPFQHSKIKKKKKRKKN